MSSPFSSPQSPRSLEAEFQQILEQQQQALQGAAQSFKKQHWLTRGLNALIDFLTGQQQLSIRAKTLKDGSVQWIVYDPSTDSREVFRSQQAVRVWIEGRYHQ